MNNKYTLFIDQYNNHFFVKSVRELRKKISNGSSTVHKMYVTRKSLNYHVGYVIAGHHLTAYRPVELPA